MAGEVLLVGAGVGSQSTPVSGYGRTYVDLTVQAASDGIITDFRVALGTICDLLKIGIVYGSAGMYTSRTFIERENVPSGVSVFDGLSIPVYAGDFLALYRYSTGVMVIDGLGSGTYNVIGDAFTGSPISYPNFNDSRSISMAAYGTLASGGAGRLIGAKSRLIGGPSPLIGGPSPLIG